jgi:hypothetical protein
MLAPYHLEDIVKRLIPVANENSVTLNFSKSVSKHIGAIKHFIRHYNQEVMKLA